MNRKCARGDHKFQPRYDVERKFPPDLSSAKVWGTKSYIDSLKETRKTYVHDICIRCGKTITRPLEKSERVEILLKELAAIAACAMCIHQDRLDYEANPTQLAYYIEKNSGTGPWNEYFRAMVLEEYKKNKIDI